MKNTRPADIYLRFLKLADAVRALPSLPALDPLEERILVLVARSGQDGERLCVRDMMAKHELGAPATVHAERGAGRLASGRAVRRHATVQVFSTSSTR
jgi:hypothetical protein